MKRSDISDVEVVRAAKALREDNRRDESGKIISVQEFFQRIFKQPPNASVFERLHHKFQDHPDKVIYAAMDRALSRGLIECGVSIRWSWPTDKGLELLAKYDQEFGVGAITGIDLGTEDQP